MKKSIIAALIAAATLPALADTMATAGNDAGGTMNLTDNTSTDCNKIPGKYFVVYSTTKNVNDAPLRGCWKVIDDNIHVLWNSGDERMFPITRFRMTAYGNRTYPSTDARSSL